MQVTAIIAEWNPLHRGHLLPVQAARQQGATHIVAILSGNFVQRGEPALCPLAVPGRRRPFQRGGSGPPAAAALCRFHRPATSPVAPWPVWPPSARWIPSSLAVSAGNWPPCGRSPPPSIPPTFRPPWPPICKGACPLQQPRQAASFIPFSGEMPACSPPPVIFSVSGLSRALRRLGSNIQPLTISRQGAPRPMPPSRIPIFPRPPSCGSVSLPARISPPPLPPAMAEQPELARAAGGPPPTGALGAGISCTPARDDRNPTMPLCRMSPRDWSTAYTGHRARQKPPRSSPAEAENQALHPRAFKAGPAGGHAGAARRAFDCGSRPTCGCWALPPRGRRSLNRARGRHALPLSASLAELEKTGEAAARFAALETRAADLYHAFTPGLAPCGSEYTTPVIKI